MTKYIIFDEQTLWSHPCGRAGEREQLKRAALEGVGEWESGREEVFVGYVTSEKWNMDMLVAQLASTRVYLSVR